MINTKTKVALAIASVLAAGTAQAATTHTLTNGSFTFYNALGVEEVASGHNDVQGTFDLFNGTGQFTTSTPFNGVTWVADVYKITMHSSAMGGTSVALEPQTYNYNVHTYVNTAATSAITGVPLTTALVTCTTGNFDGCAQVGITAGVDTLFSAPGSYSYDLGPGMFGVETYFDWSVNMDIPVLAVLQVTSGNPMTGPATVVSVDSDGDGTPGTAMATSPFPGQTPAFAGTMVPVAAVPVPAAVWLFGSGLLGLVGVARRKKASV